MRAFVKWSSCAAVLVAFAVAAAACHKGGNGIGTAPGESAPCPAVCPVAGSSCLTPDFPENPQVCDYPAGACGVGGDAAPSEASAPDATDGAAGGADAVVYMFCPGGTGATWQLVAPGDAGVEETGGEAGDAADAEAGDAADAADAADVGGDADAAVGDADAADAVEETSDAADAIEETSDAADDVTDGADETSDADASD